MSKSKCSTKRGKGQSDSEHRRQLQERIVSVGYVDGTRVAYLREFDRFEAKLDRKSGATANVGDARRYLSRIKQHGVPKGRYSFRSSLPRSPPRPGRCPPPDPAHRPRAHGSCTPNPSDPAPTR